MENGAEEESALLWDVREKKQILSGGMREIS